MARLASRRGYVGTKERVPGTPDEGVTTGVRVLVVDDVALARQTIRSALETDPEITVVGEAENGAEAVALAARLQPDVITMDVLMPVMDGYEATERIMAAHPTPIVAVTSLPLADGSVLGRMLAAGAVDVVAKAFGREPAQRERMRRALVAAVRAAASAGVRRPGRVLLREQGLASGQQARLAVRRQVDVVVVAASTGGPGALQVLLRGLPRSTRFPVLVVQHIADGFADWLAEWLGRGVELPVSVARDGLRAEPGHVYLAPCDWHMLVTPNRTIRLNRALPVGGLRPSADVLFRSASQSFGPGVVGIVLTGMGEDGAEGARAIRSAGGIVLVQDEETSAIWGMPRAVISAGAADAVLPLSEIPVRLCALCRMEGLP